MADRECVLATGITEEADCWASAARLASAHFQLRLSHPMGEQEVSTAIHATQNKHLARPTSRRYFEVAKAARGLRVDRPE